MRAVFLTFFLVACSSAHVQVQQALENGLHPFSADMVNLINNVQNTWTAEQHFSEKDMENVLVKLGTILGHNELIEPVNEANHFDMSVEIPTEFDGRKQWPKCKDIISDIRDQANCGSCWAFGAVGAMSDRTCIASNGELQVKLSADDLLSCCNNCGYGCEGGYLTSAWSYWLNEGIVSGGNFNETSTCRPYEIEPCGHHTPKSHPCIGIADTPNCDEHCVNGADYQKDKHYGSKSYTLSGEGQIQRDILAYGSVEAGFTVYSDFPQYKSGVYIATSEQALGGHAVRILGWGVENGTSYWLVANSWATDWGMDGYFKILRGEDHCGIESEVVAGLPKL